MSGDFGSIFGMIGSVIGGAIGGPPGAFFGGTIGGMMDGQKPGQAAFSGGMSAIGAGISGGFGGGLGSAGGSGVGGAGDIMLGSSAGDLGSAGFSGGGDLFGAGVNDSFGTNSLFGPSVFDGGMTFGPTFVGSGGGGGSMFSDAGSFDFGGMGGNEFTGDIFADPTRRLGARGFGAMGMPAQPATFTAGPQGAAGFAGDADSGMPEQMGWPGASPNVFSGGMPGPQMGTGLNGMDLAQLGQVASTLPAGPAGPAAPTGIWDTVKGGLEDIGKFMKSPAGQGLGKLYNLGTGIYGMVRANQLRAAMDPFAGQRSAFAARAGALMRNPSSIVNTPGYLAGLKAVERRLAAQGYTGSGRAMAALAQYGGNQFNSTLDQYARLGGAGVQPGVGDLAQLSLQGQALQRLATGVM